MPSSKAVQRSSSVSRKSNDSAGSGVKKVKTTKALEDTWTPDELATSLGTKKDKPRDKDRDHKKDRSRDKHDKDDDKKQRKKRDEENDRDHRKERRHRDKENGEVEKRRDKDRDREKDRDRDRNKDRDRDRKGDRDKDKHRSSKHREEDDRKHKKDEKRKKDDGDEREKRHRRRGDEDEDERRRRKEEKRHKEKRDDDDKDRKHRRHRDEDDKERRRDRDRDSSRDGRRRDRDGRGKGDGERKHRRHRDNEDSGSRRRHRKDKDEDGRPQHKGDDREKQRRHRDGDGDDNRHRRKKHRDDEDNERHSNSEDEEGESKPKRSDKDRKSQKPESIQGDTANGDDDYNYDDDDFEDYDDDFEDDGDDSDDQDDSDDDDDPKSSKSREEVDDVLKAMNEENDRLLKESRRAESYSREREEHQRQNRPTTAQKRTFINFVSAKQRQITEKASNKTKRRGQELLKIIELDMAGYDMFELPPVKEYDMYIRSFGRSDTQQAYVQTNDDNIDRDVQTEDIETCEKWTQHPAEDVRGSGGGEGDTTEEETMGKPVDSIRLGKFLQRAGQVIAILLDEEASENKSEDKENKKKSNVMISDDFVELNKLPYLKGRHVISSYFSPVQTNILLTVFSGPKKPSEDPFGSLGFVCLWNINEPSRPQKVLVSASRPCCCCFGPSKSTLAFAGMSDGSLVVWDTREPASMHHGHKTEKEEILLRYPTYNTASVLASDNHLSAITSVVPIVATGDSAVASLEKSSDQDLDSEHSFQLATMEQNGILNLWVVAEISNPDLGGSTSDYGLAPGGRVKLLKSSTVILENPLRDARLRTTMRAFEMQLLPSDPSHFYVGTDTGCVVHGVRYGGKAPPKAYRQEIDAPVEVMSVDFSPFSEPVFLAGCADGSLRLYTIHSDTAVIVWPDATGGRSIKMVRWCRSRPSVFFVLDEESHLHIWDLIMSDATPLKDEKISAQRVTSIALSNDHSATGLGTPGRRPQMVVSLDDGSTEVHTISQQFSALMPEEVDAFADFLARIV